MICGPIRRSWTLPRPKCPVLPLRFGTILTSEDAVAKELLAAHHDEFTAALDQLEGRIEFRVKGRYVKDAVLGEVLSQNKRRDGGCEGKDLRLVPEGR
jgi:hypothetical protein